ncbi:MAG: peroxiredoxin [Candidatus Binataceae bacterium]
MLLQAGDPAPGFTLKTHEGKPLSLADLRGRKVLLWFYPEAETPGCTLEGCSLRDQRSYYDDNGVAIIGISFDDVERNAAFAARHQFGFPLLSDSDREVGLAYGACTDRKDRYAARISYLISEEGVVERVYPQVDPRDHAAQVIIDLLGL